MNQPPDVEIQSQSGLLRVLFAWNQDRYQHTVFCNDQPVLLSAEGTASDEWPQSPPLTQLSLEVIDSRKVILGVGAAGVGHWSVSVESVTVDDRDCLRFDLACRSKQTPLALGSCYRFLDASPKLHFQADEKTQKTSRETTVHFAPLASLETGTNQWTYSIVASTTRPLAASQ